MILDLKKLAVPLAVFVPLVTAVAGFAGATLLDRERIDNLRADTAQHAQQIDVLRNKHDEEHVQIEVLKTDVKYIREGVDRIESHLPVPK